jgi:L,D-transpeptidase ErfK/SrfK
MDWNTPLGRAAITAKTRKPAWYPPASIREEYAAEGRELPRVVPPGPDNPLGEYALRLSVPGYLIHGTNRPAGVGMRVTHGCIRMFPEDIEWLFPRVQVKTAVRLVNQPVKLGWRGDDVMLEVHPTLEEDATGRERGMTFITERYVELTRERPAAVDWQLVEQVYREQRGIPVHVGSAAAAAPAVAVRH